MNKIREAESGVRGPGHREQQGVNRSPWQRVKQKLCLRMSSLGRAHPMDQSSPTGRSPTGSSPTGQSSPTGSSPTFCTQNVSLRALKKRYSYEPFCKFPFVVIHYLVCSTFCFTALLSFRSVWVLSVPWIKSLSDITHCVLTLLGRYAL